MFKIHGGIFFEKLGFFIFSKKRYKLRKGGESLSKKQTF
jgi:hypothetical protein